MIFKQKILSYFFLSLAFSINANAQCWSAISAGDVHSVAIKTDGTLWAWGHNGQGQLGNGDGSAANKNTPIRIGALADNNWSKISAGEAHTVALKTDGTLWAWGYNSQGQLGDGSAANKNAPIRIGALADSNWSKISAGGAHTVAIKTDGTLWAWGDNDDGELGTGTTNNENTPTQIGTDSTWSEISAGGTHTVAIKTDGTLWAWGHNYYAQLGNGSSKNENTPTKIGADSNWSTISAGKYYTMAIKTDGTLWAWGSNNRYVLGDGTTADRRRPKLIGSNYSSISAGSDHTLAIRTEGALSAWGYNYSGQLGNRTTLDISTPTQIGNDLSWSAIDNGQRHSIALKTDGTLWAWGGNLHGQLGNGKSGLGANTIPIQITCPNAKVQENNLDNSVSIYPNPTKSQFTVITDAKLSGTFYNVYDNIGRLVLTGKINIEITEIELRNLSSGTYLIRLGDNLIQTFKVIKE